MSEILKSENEANAWEGFVSAWGKYTYARKVLLADTSSVVEWVRQGLINPNQRLAALDLAQYMTLDQLQQLIENLLTIAAYSNGAGHSIACELILKLPYQWLVENIEIYAEKILVNEDEFDYRGLFTLYHQIDRNLAQRLAQRALASPDLEIREAGSYFQETLNRLE